MAKTVLVIGGKHFLFEACNILSSIGMHVSVAADEKEIKDKCKQENVDAVVFDDDMCRSQMKDSRSKIIKAVRESKKCFIMVSSGATTMAVLEANGLGASDYIIKPFNRREFISRFNAVVRKETRISCVGGGTGLFHILLGLKEFPGILLSSIVSMSDDGGSSGKLRASFGILPPGDVRRSLVALSNAPEIMNEMMRYRFQRGEGVKGHSFGNLFLTALAEIKGSMPEAVRTMGDILNIQGIVIPVTNMKATLCARFEDGTVVKGESKIDMSHGRDPRQRVCETWHEPKTKCNVNAFSSILNSEIVIIGPGDLFTSVITNLLVKNVREALCRTRAKKIYMCNLMTKPGETAGFTAFDHVREITRYMGGDYLDYVIISNTKLSRKAILEYAKKDQVPVAAGDIGKIRRLTKAKIIMANIGHETELVRHDSVKVTKEINKILKQELKK